MQIEQDFALCASKFPGLIHQPIGAQFIESNLIALFSFELTGTQIRIHTEKHYRFIPPEQLTTAELAAYQARPR